MDKTPNKKTLFPLENYNKLCFLKNLIKHPNIIIGDYTYYDDFEDVAKFENNVRYLFEFSRDKLIIGKFCQIASGVTFIMNGGNHLVESLSSYPFSIFGGAWEEAMDGKEYPFKGDTIVGNDVWLGYNATILAGVKIGDGVIVAANSTVTKDIEPYSIVGGNLAKLIRKRFDENTTAKLLALKWWDWDIDRITKNINVLTGKDVDQLE